jgi:arginine repressor
MLRKHGHVATQSSVSRDLRELGVAKLGDRYVLPETALSPVKNDFSTSSNSSMRR